MRDIVVIESLRKRGIGLNNMQEVLKYESVERKPRVLDKPPKRLVLTKAVDVKAYGCRAEFIMCYEDKKSSCKRETASLDLKGVVRYCDVDVYLVLQTLIEQGFCKIEERATACFDLFRTIMTTPGETLTVGRVYDALKEYTPTSYYAGELVKAIHVCIFNEKAPALYWMDLCEYTGFYRNAIELGKAVIRDNCETEKDVEKFLRPLYKQAKSDEEFISKIYTAGANKWLIPMIYYLKDTHPEVLESNTTGGGFA